MWTKALHRFRVPWFIPGRALLLLNLALLSSLGGLPRVRTPIPARPTSAPVSSGTDLTVSGDPYLERQLQALRPDFAEAALRVGDSPRYTIEARFVPEPPQISGRLTLHYTHREPGALDMLVFRLLSNAATIYAGGQTRVSRVWLDGVPVSPLHSSDPTVLRVPLDPPLLEGGRVAVDIDFATDIPRTSPSGYGILRHTIAVTSLAGWYPVLAPHRGDWQVHPTPHVGDANDHEMAFYELGLSAPAQYGLAATGRVLEHGVTDGEAHWLLVSGPARDLTLLLSDRFQTLEEVVGGVTIRYHALPAARAATSPAAALGIARDAYSTYSARFGAYPYAELEVVEAPVSIGGYEFTGMVSIDHNLRTQGSLGRLRFMLAHEVAHQWWYAQVGNDAVHEPWVDEALATYSVLLYEEEHVGPQAVASSLAYYRSEAAAAGRGVCIATPTTQFGSWATYRKPVYYRGALFFQAARETLGDEVFLSFLQTYVEAHRFGVATSEGLLHLLEELGGDAARQLREEWFSPGACGDLLDAH